MTARVLMNGDQARCASTLFEDLAHAMAGRLRRDHADIDIRGWLDGSVTDVEAVCEHHGFAGGKVWRDGVGIYLALRLIGGEQHDDIGPFGCFGGGHDLQPGAFGAGFYATRFVDFRSARDGLYRKYRAIFVDRAAHPYHLAVADSWLAHYATADMAGAGRRAEELRFLVDPSSALGEGAMAVLLGLDFDQARAVAEEAAQGEVCEAANDNGGGQVVLSGEKGAVEHAVEIAKAHGVRRAMMLRVSAPFHCSLMRPAADAMAEALANVTVKKPRVPLVANVRAAPISEPADIVQSLIDQVTGTVRWRESIQFMTQHGVGRFYEIGAGRVLAGLIKRVAEAAETSSIGTPDDVAQFKAARG